MSRGECRLECKFRIFSWNCAPEKYQVPLKRTIAFFPVDHSTGYRISSIIASKYLVAACNDSIRVPGGYLR